MTKTKATAKPVESGPAELNGEALDRATGGSVLIYNVYTSGATSGSNTFPRLTPRFETFTPAG